MAWTEITREHYRRDNARQASDMTEAEWLLLSFFFPNATISDARAKSICVQ